MDHSGHVVIKLVTVYVCNYSLNPMHVEAGVLYYYLMTSLVVSNSTNFTLLNLLFLQQLVRNVALKLQVFITLLECEIFSPSSFS
jgi:hypothetical protein